MIVYACCEFQVDKAHNKKNETSNSFELRDFLNIAERINLYHVFSTNRIFSTKISRSSLLKRLEISGSRFVLMCIKVCLSSI